MMGVNLRRDALTEVRDRGSTSEAALYTFWRLPSSRRGALYAFELTVTTPRSRLTGRASRLTTKVSCPRQSWSVLASFGDARTNPLKACTEFGAVLGSVREALEGFRIPVAIARHRADTFRDAIMRREKAANAGLNAGDDC